ncbi:MAG: PKD domain-containing protein [Chitinophagales bacterium]|nr:PKD domain-containing protein [Chitinophagales bacterium]
MNHKKKIISSAKYFALLCILFLGYANQSIAQVNAAFTSDSTQGCDFLELQLINLSTGATDYVWQVTDAGGTVMGNSILENPTFFLAGEGSYTVQLIANGPGGSDTLIVPAFANIYAPPVAIINATELEGCNGATLSFSDGSIAGGFGSISDRYWVITGAPAFPDDPTITYTFPSPGIYTVYLFINDAIGCTAFTTTEVTIYEETISNFAVDTFLSCTTPFTVSFTNLSTGSSPLNYLWNFGDGFTSTAASPSHTYTSFGNFSVSLYVSNTFGCDDIVIYPNYIQINPTPDVDFIPSSNTVCSGGSITFDNTSASTSAVWFWDFGDGTTSTEFEPTHTYTTPGSYTVSLTGDFGADCVGTISYTDIITVNISPTVIFNSSDPSSICELPYTVNFGTSVTGGPVMYAWTFEDVGGSGTASGASPHYTYDDYGLFDVTVTVTNVNGCTATYSQTDYVSIGELTLTPDFLQVLGCVPMPTSFAVNAGEELVSYSWDLGNGTTSNLAEPIAFYTDTGCYTISVTATSINGCTATAIFPNFVCVGDTATANVIVPDTSCPSVAIEVLNLPLDSIIINIDGGLDQVSSSAIDSITYFSMTAGAHELEIVTFMYGCRDTAYANIFILDVDDSSLVVIYDCDNPYSVQFFIDTAYSNASCGWVWDFGDGTQDSINENPIHIYNDPGSYSVTLTYSCITLNECEGNGLTANITIPISSFTPSSNNGCVIPYTISFTNFSTDSSANDLIYQWNFGDGTTSTEISPTHTYTDYGIYIVKLKVIDIHGCFDNFLDTIFISEVNASYTATNYGGCIPYTFTMNNTTINPYGAIESYIINWDDGIIDTFYSASDVISVAHDYTIEDYYYVSLTVTNEFGCVSIYTDTIIASDPVNDFSVNDTFPCIGQEIYFNELSSGLELEYLWHFGDGSTSTEANPSHSYNTFGSFTVGLLITDINGCTEAKNKSFYITTDSAIIDIAANALVANCNYALIQFTALPEDSVCSYFWEFGDGGTSTEPNPVYPYIAAGVYSVALTITSCNDCVNSVVKEDFITVPGPYGEISVSDDSLCVNEEITFQILVASTDSITLYFDNGDAIGFDVVFSDTLTNIEISYGYNTDGNFLPVVVAMDTGGCISLITLSDSIKIGNYPIAGFDISEETFCVGTIITYTDTSQETSSGDLWTWNLGDDTYETTESDTFNYVYNTPGIYAVSLITETTFGCADTITNELEVLPYPIVTISDDTTICPGFDIPLEATGIGNYTWSPSTGLNDSTLSNPIASPEITTTYLVDVNNGYCSSYDSVTIFVADKIVLDAGPDTGFCLGEEVELYALFYEGVDSDFINFFWTPSSYLSDETISNPISSPLENITYTLVASCGTLTDSAQVSITVEPLPDIEILEDTILIIQGQSVEITAEFIGGTTPSNWLWEPAVAVDCPTCQIVIADPKQSAIFSCTAFTEYGCSDVDFVYLKVRTCDNSLFKLPNLITPNNDGFNDRFNFTYEGLTAFKNIRIYDRWGKIMFQTTDPENTWDGYFKGKLCDAGVYVYAMDVICIDGDYGVITGNITLIR